MSEPGEDAEKKMKTSEEDKNPQVSTADTPSIITAGGESHADDADEKNQHREGANAKGSGENKEDCLGEDATAQVKDVQEFTVKVEECEDEEDDVVDGEEDELQDELDDGQELTPAKTPCTENDDPLSDTLDSGQEENEREIMLNSKGMEDDEEDDEENRDSSDAKERILLAAENGEEDIIQELLSNDPMLVNVRDGDSYTPLHRACYNNNVEVIKALLSHGADISAKTEELWEPLHCACKWDNVEAASLLIHNGANVNAVSKGGLTPLHLAAANKNGRRTIELLLWHPYIDATLKNTAGDTAYDIAYRSGPVAGLFEMLEDSVNVC